MVQQQQQQANLCRAQPSCFADNSTTIILQQQQQQQEAPRRQMYCQTVLPSVWWQVLLLERQARRMMSSSSRHRGGALSGPRRGLIRHQSHPAREEAMAEYWNCPRPELHRIHPHSSNISSNISNRQRLGSRAPNRVCPSPACTSVV